MVGKPNQKSGAENAYRKISLSVADSETTICMLNKMIRQHVPTNDVMNFSLKQLALRRVHKETNCKIEKVAMKAKRDDALAFVKRLRRERYRLKLEILEFYEPDTTKANRVIDKINKNCFEYKKIILHRKLDKEEFLKAKL